MMYLHIVILALTFASTTGLLLFFCAFFIILLLLHSVFNEYFHYFEIIIYKLHIRPIFYYVLIWALKSFLIYIYILFLHLHLVTSQNNIFIYYIFIYFYYLFTYFLFTSLQLKSAY